METNSVSHDLIILEENLVRAEAGKRFLNYLIDLLFFYVLIFGGGICMAILAPSLMENFNNSPGSKFIDQLIFILLYGAYMGIIESLFKGKSVGKFITRTRAVNVDGTKIGWDKAFARGFSRAVPFCAFSAFGTPCCPWQDRWTSTMVIDERKSD